MVAGAIILFLYLVGLFAEFLGACACPRPAKPQYTYAPPQGLSFFVSKPDGSSNSISTSRATRSRSTRWRCSRTFVVDDAKVVPIGFFVKGPAYKLWGLIPMDRAPHRPDQPQ